jgi:hypothetical protein
MPYGSPLPDTRRALEPADRALRIARKERLVACLESHVTDLREALAEPADPQAYAALCAANRLLDQESAELWALEDDPSHQTLLHAHGTHQTQLVAVLHAHLETTRARYNYARRRGGEAERAEYAMARAAFEGEVERLRWTDPSALPPSIYPTPDDLVDGWSLDPEDEYPSGGGGASSDDTCDPESEPDTPIVTPKSGRTRLAWTPDSELKTEGTTGKNTCKRPAGEAEVS